jgi:hypothetical protein
MLSVDLIQTLVLRKYYHFLPMTGAVCCSTLDLIWTEHATYDALCFCRYLLHVESCVLQCIIVYVRIWNRQTSV